MPPEFNKIGPMTEADLFMMGTPDIDWEIADVPKVRRETNHGPAFDPSFLHQEIARLEQIHAANIGGLTSFRQVEHYITQNELFTWNPNGGMYHSEHILKILKYAQRFGDSNVMPNYAGLREKVSSLLGDIPSEKVISSEEGFREILTTDFAELKLSETEIDNISSKMNLGVYFSIDVPLDNSVLLLNSQSGIKTLFSCAGHKDEIDYSYGYGFMHIVFNSDDFSLIKAIQEGLNTHSNETYTVKLTGNGQNYEISYENFIPPKEWLEMHKTAQYDVYFRQKIAELESVLNIPIHLSTTKQYHGLPEDLRSAVENKYRENVEVGEIDEQSISLSELMPISEWQYYYEYLTSDDARKNRDQAIAIMEQSLQTLRHAA